MRKITIILIIVLLLIGSGVIIFSNQTSSYITLDINPSFKLYLTRNNKVKKIEALNEDAKDIIANIKIDSLDGAIKSIRDNLVDKGYIEDGKVAVLIYSNSSNTTDVEKIINDSFNEKGIQAETIAINTITADDEKLAEEYNISPAKAAYINMVLEEKDYINVDNVIDKSINEIKETEETGKFCDKDYSLNGDWCYKEIGTEPALSGNVCPEGYYEINGVCYEEVGVIDTGVFFCNSDYELVDNDCVKYESYPAEVESYTCSEGEVKTKYDVGKGVKGSGDSREFVCVDPATKTKTVTPCELPAGDSTERMSSGGRCYWHRAPVISSGCPGKIKVNGSCWDDASNVYLCPYTDAVRSKDEYCYKELKNVKPTVSSYKCEEGAILEGNKCNVERKMAAISERVCPDGYTKTEDDKCINYNKKINKVEGYYCEKDNARLKGDICIIYDIVESN